MTQPLTQQQIAEIKALEGKGEKSYPFHNTVLRLIATLEARDAAFEEMLEALKPLVEACEKDFTSDETNDCADDELVAYGNDTELKFCHIRKARSAIAHAEKVKW